MTRPTQKPLIEVTNLHLTLGSAAGDVHILRGIDLLVQPGESVGIVGPSGSGKSTLMSMIAGLEHPSEGSVTVAGAHLGGMDEDALARHRRETTGIVLQSFHLIPTMTALENVAIPLELGGAVDAFEKAEAALARVGLDTRLTHYPAQLSGGEQQRVALARAVVSEPPLLLADEPTGNLDGQTGERIIELMFGLHRQNGGTLVLITHDKGLAERCDRVVELRDGRVVVERSTNVGASVSDAANAVAAQ
ncbi:MAG: ABC transporter ATP-binding protein [Pseudomonadota bacterium]